MFHPYIFYGSSWRSKRNVIDTLFIQGSPHIYNVNDDMHIREKTNSYCIISYSVSIISDLEYQEEPK